MFNNNMNNSPVTPKRNNHDHFFIPENYVLIDIWKHHNYYFTMTDGLRISLKECMALNEILFMYILKENMQARTLNSFEDTEELFREIRAAKSAILIYHQILKNL